MKRLQSDSRRDSRRRPGLLFTLVGPAGAGKNRLMNHVLTLTSLHQLPTATTRPMRPGEQQDREHLFVSREAFERMIERDELLEHQVIHGNLYGMPRAAVEAALDKGEAIIADIEVLGAARARSAYPDNVVSIFIQAPSIGSLIERMRERRESEAEISKRLLRVPMELAFAPECDYVILNDSFDHAAAVLYDIVAAEIDGAELANGDPLIDYQFGYFAQIIPTHDDDVLRQTTAPADPTIQFSGDELPHVAALRCLRELLPIRVDAAALIGGGAPDGKFLPPVALGYTLDGRVERITYVYYYRLDQRIEPPPGWTWTPAEALRNPAEKVE